MSEFSRIYDIRHLPTAPLELTATAEECAALAKRFALVAVKSLHAAIRLDGAGARISAKGRLTAEVVQSCAVSGDDLPARIDEPVDLRFVPAADSHAEEVELAAEELDEIEYSGGQFDLGEALAQTMALAIDPFATGPRANAARQAAGMLDEGQSGPFAALKGLLKS
ncbi:DUF177 domain-containing protein [Novosphingobium sp.]|uniref:YceD family protein n=1 Tax=Novosphingobium sp. TaxID=1874826 RepID=UPI0035B4456F